MSDEKESLHQAQIERWRRKQYDARDAHDAAVSGMKNFLKRAIKENKTTRNNVAKELVEYLTGVRRGEIRTGHGFNTQKDPTTVISPEGIETVTGYGARPWEEDDDYGDNEN